MVEKIVLSVEKDSEEGVATINKTKKPPLYKVLLHNDDYTTMEFVIFILQKVFGKNEDEGHAIMLKVHHEGVGVCGVFTKEIAESKTAQVGRLAREQGHPLRCTFEPDA